MSDLLALEDVAKVYRLGGETIYALREVNLAVAAGEYVALLGPSGSGKSTLMNIIGCLDQPTSGQYRLGGEEVSRLDDKALAEIRAQRIGFVFQNFNLIPRLSALANVERALIYQGVPAGRRRKIAQDALARVGLSDRLQHLPTELSGGQRQRVAIARALSTRPSLLIADEPTGNLDVVSADKILALFEKLNQDGATIIVVTHDPAVAQRCHRAVILHDGRIRTTLDGNP